MTASAPVFSADGRDAEIGFQVSEGPLYRFAVPRWEGATVYTPAVLRATTVFRGGEAFDQSQIDDTITEATNALHRARLPDGAAHRRRSWKPLGDSVRVVVPGRGGQALPRRGDPHRGQHRNQGARDPARAQPLPGEPAAPQPAAALAARRLRHRVTSRTCRSSSSPGTKEDEVDVTFRVKEKSSVTATAGAGYSSQAGLTGFVEFGHNNLFGNGQAVSLKLEHGAKTRLLRHLLHRAVGLGAGRSRRASTSTSTEAYREIYARRDEDQSYWQTRRGGGRARRLPLVPALSRLLPARLRLLLHRHALPRHRPACPTATQELLESSQGSLVADLRLASPATRRTIRSTRRWARARPGAASSIGGLPRAATWTSTAHRRPPAVLRRPSGSRS